MSYKTIVSIWTIYVALIGGVLLRRTPFFKSPIYQKHSKPALIVICHAQKGVLNYPALWQENARLKGKNNLLTLAYNVKEEVSPPVAKVPQPGKQTAVRQRRKRRRKVHAAAKQSTARVAPIKQTPRRRRMRGKRKQFLQAQQAKSSSLRSKPLKNVTIKVTSIKPATAHATWKKLQREPLFAWPVASEHFWVSSLFGPRRLGGRLGFHAGVDMAAPRGTPVYAAGAGIL